MAVFSNFPVTLPVMYSPTETSCHVLHPLMCAAGKERGEPTPSFRTASFVSCSAFAVRLSLSSFIKLLSQLSLLMLLTC